MFRDGRGEGGEEPPNNWQSLFGAAASTGHRSGRHAGPVVPAPVRRVAARPDWSNEEVREEFRRILRFWLDRGVDGFRVDVAHGLVKRDGLPDYTPPEDGDSMGGIEPAPYFGQDGVHDVYRDWRKVLDEYDGERALCAEAWMPTVDEIAKWVRPDEMHQAFNFALRDDEVERSNLREVIIDSLRAFPDVGAPATWVLSNHDVIRHTTRLALPADVPQGHGIGPKTPDLPDTAVGLHRGRAATTLMLALPGSAYLYQGEELGLPEAVDLPDDARQDPTWFRHNGERYGRDGCRTCRSVGGGRAGVRVQPDR